MAQVWDNVHESCEEIVSDGSKILDEEFVMNLFHTFYEHSTELQEFLDYYFKEKESFVCGSLRKEDRVLAIDTARFEL